MVVGMGEFEDRIHLDVWGETSYHQIVPRLSHLLGFSNQIEYFGMSDASPSSMPVVNSLSEDGC